MSIAAPVIYIRHNVARLRAIKRHHGVIIIVEELRIVEPATVYFGIGVAVAVNTIGRWRNLFGVWKVFSQPHTRGGDLSRSNLLRLAGRIRYVTMLDGSALAGSQYRHMDLPSLVIRLRFSPQSILSGQAKPVQRCWLSEAKPPALQRGKGH